MVGKISFVACLVFPAAIAAHAQAYLTRDQALKEAFPGAESIERKTAFLTDAQVEKIQKSARARMESRIVTYYVGRSDTTILGYAFFETHTVRTMPETFMTVVNPDGSVKQVEILAFYEPEDYRPSERWLNQLAGQSLTDDLWLKRGVRSISGATLSAHAIIQGVRRMLAIFEVAVRPTDILHRGKSSQ